jgi:hypothetical protein
MFSEDVEKNDIVIPQLYAKAINYIGAVKQKMLDDGLPQNKVDEYFKIDGNKNLLESGEAIKLYIIRPEASLGGGPGGLVFNPVEMTNMVNTGKGAAQNFIAKLDPQEVTWIV